LKEWHSSKQFGRNYTLHSPDFGFINSLKMYPTTKNYKSFYDMAYWKRKTHTYSCEQNAQILMRLERERNRKLSLTGMETGLGIGLGLGMGGASAAPGAAGDPQVSEIPPHFV